MSAEEWSSHCERLAAWDRFRIFDTTNPTTQEAETNA